MKSDLSKRSQELLAVLWDAFYSGDRWVRMTNKSTARMTGTALVWRGLAEFDETQLEGGDSGYYSTRIRLSEAILNENGLTRGVRFFAGATLNQLDAINDSIDAAVAA